MQSRVHIVTREMCLGVGLIDNVWIAYSNAMIDRFYYHFRVSNMYDLWDQKYYISHDTCESELWFFYMWATHDYLWVILTCVNTSQSTSQHSIMQFSQHSIMNDFEQTSWVSLVMEVLRLDVWEWSKFCLPICSM